jgi:hypothetical protein
VGNCLKSFFCFLIGQFPTHCSRVEQDPQDFPESRAVESLLEFRAEIGQGNVELSAVFYEDVSEPFAVATFGWADTNYVVKLAGGGSLGFNCTGLGCTLTVVLIVIRVHCPGPLPGRLGWALVVDVAELLEGEDRRSFSVRSGSYIIPKIHSRTVNVLFQPLKLYLGFLTRASASSGSTCSTRKKFLLTLFMS